MIKYSFIASALFTGIALSGVSAAPAFAQSYGVMPRAACSKSMAHSSTVKSSAPQPQVQYQQVAHDAGDSAPVRQTQRPRRRGFGSPF